MSNRSFCSAVAVGVAALCVIVFSLLLFSRAGSMEPLILASESDPDEVADSFLKAVCDGRFDDASVLLFECEDLGLEWDGENNPAGKLVYGALLDSFGYKISGSALVSGINAELPVTITSLDLSTLLDGQHECTMTVLERYVDEARLNSDIYDEKGVFRDDVAQRALVESTEMILERADEFTNVNELTLKLIYSESTWQIVLDDALTAALTGGAA